MPAVRPRERAAEVLTCRRAPGRDSSLPSLKPNMPQTIAVLDFGSQYTQVIARRIRECQVFSKIYHFSTPAETLRTDGVIGIVLSGGPSSVFSADAPIPDKRIFELGVPVLGICYGIQLMGHLLGGKVARGERREYGHGTLEIQRQGRLFAGLPKAASGLEFARGQADEAAPGLCRDRQDRELALRGDRGPPRAISTGSSSIPRCSTPSAGIDILNNFLAGVCRASQDWTTKDFIEHAVQEIRATVGKSRVILGLSGGRRLLGRRRADPQGDRAPAHVRLRRQRPPAQGRAGDRREPLQAQFQDRPEGRRRRRAFPSRAPGGR